MRGFLFKDLKNGIPEDARGINEEFHEDVMLGFLKFLEHFREGIIAKTEILNRGVAIDAATRNTSQISDEWSGAWKVFFYHLQNGWICIFLLDVSRPLDVLPSLRSRSLFVGENEIEEEANQRQCVHKKQPGDFIGIGDGAVDDVDTAENIDNDDAGKDEKDQIRVRLRDD